VAELSRFYGIVIALYTRGELGRHNLPHVHVSYSGDSAQVGLDGTVLAGWLPRNARRLVKQWLHENSTEVTAAWQDMRDGRKIRKVEPLA